MMERERKSKKEEQKEEQKEKRRGKRKSLRILLDHQFLSSQLFFTSFCFKEEISAPNKEISAPNEIILLDKLSSGQNRKRKKREKEEKPVCS
jgi:hypothetical protein